MSPARARLPALAAVAVLAWAGAATAQPKPRGITEAESRLLSQRLVLPDLAAVPALPSFFRNRSLRTFDFALKRPDKKDSDSDGLTDQEEAFLGTNPLKSDTDDDGLPDGWEVQKTNGIDLRALGASPTHKDIFVQMDYMERANATNGLGPNPAVVAGIIAAFADAPVANPDGKTGIAIHLITGSKLDYEADLSPVIPAVEELKRLHFDANRAPMFHYMIWANTYNGGTSSGYSLQIPGSDFVVTLGGWHGGDGGSDLEKIGTFVHELGHNFGLRHGQFEDLNYKPNHLSVMNYAFQTEGVMIGGVRRFTYQRIPLPALDEPALDETTGLGTNAALKGGRTIWFQAGPNRFVEGATDGAIDWNSSGATNPAPVAADLNGDQKRMTLGPTQAEWPRLVFDGGAIGKTAALQGLLALPAQLAPAPPTEELTQELSQRLLERRSVEEFVVQP